MPGLSACSQAIADGENLVLNHKDTKEPGQRSVQAPHFGTQDPPSLIRLVASSGCTEEHRVSVPRPESPAPPPARASSHLRG